MKLWIDDVRPPPDDTWWWATNATDAIAQIMLAEYTVISFDHDLGEEETGYDLLCLIERQIAKGGWWRPIPELKVHSANPVGRNNMLRAIASIKKMAEEFGIDTLPLVD